MTLVDADALASSPAAWINASLSQEGDDPLELRLSVLLTKLQLAAVDVDTDVQGRCASLAAVSPGVSRELSLVREQATAVRAELAALVDEVGALEGRSTAAVAPLRDVLRVRERLASAVGMLRRAERVSSLLRQAEGAYGRGDAAGAAAGVAELSGALDALAPSELASLFPEARSRVAALRSLLLERLQPELLQALREHDSQAVSRLSGTFRALGSGAAVRDAYVACQQGPLFETWNLARREPTAAALRSLWKFVGETSAAEKAWAAQVFPGDDDLVAELLAEALEAMGPQMASSLLAAVDPTAADTASLHTAEAAEGGGDDEALGALWREALAHAASVGAALDGASVACVSRIHRGLLTPFEQAQRRHAAALGARTQLRLPALPAGGGASRPLAHAAEAIERSVEPLLEVLRAAAAAALRFGGALGGANVPDVLGELAETHAANLAAALPPLRAHADASSSHAAAAAAAAAAADRDPDDDEEEEEEEGPREALALVGALQGLRLGLERLDAAVGAMAAAEAAACADSALHSDAHREAAAAIAASVDGPCLPRVAAVAAALLGRGQRAALASLEAPAVAALGAIGSAELREVWRGHGALHGSSRRGVPQDDEELAAAMLAFSPSPQPYITQLGEHLLGLPLQLEPFASGSTLDHLQPQLRAPSSTDGAEADGATEWLSALGHRTTLSLLSCVGQLGALSTLGAKQLASDASYVNNILSAGLGLPHDEGLATLAALLTAPTAELPAAVAAGAAALPTGLAAAIAAKRGVQLG